MVHRLVSVMLALGLCLAVVRPVFAQDSPFAIGGGVGYVFDYHSDAVVVNAVARIPVNFKRSWLKPNVVTPRFEYFPTYNGFQVDLDALWDVPVVEGTPVRPYLGLGIGLAHSDGTTSYLFNFDAGVRYKKPSWKHEFALETHYSAGLDFDNSMALNFIVFFPIKGR